jgi:DNA transformation protein
MSLPAVHKFAFAENSILVPFENPQDSLQAAKVGISIARHVRGQLVLCKSFAPEVMRPRQAKSMFGGVGIYAQGLFFALIAEDRLYFKVDDATRPDFEQREMEPFRPFGEDSAMGYYEVPADVVEDVVQLEFWMRKAIDVAKRGKPKRSK